MGNTTVRGSEVQPGQVIKSAGRWYTVKKIYVSQDGRIREAIVLDSKGASGTLLVYIGEDYPVKAAKPPARQKITYAKAARFVAAMAALQECDDCPPGLRAALDDARAEISPWYDREGELMIDDFQTRAIGNLRKRHEDKIRQNAERIQEYVGYLLARLDGGNVTSVTHHAAGIASDAREIVSRLAALEAVAEAAGILETTED